MRSIIEGFNSIFESFLSLFGFNVLDYKIKNKENIFVSIDEDLKKISEDATKVLGYNGEEDEN